MSELKTDQKTWDLRFLRLAQEISTWSKDPSTKVGCVIVNADRRPISFGYNGFPRGIPDQTEILNDREQKYKRVLHAEQNAILFASTNDLTGCTVYITHCPCSQCVASLIQLNITRVVTIKQADFEQRWKDNIAVTLELLRLSEIPYTNYIYLPNIDDFL
jgi:dCMP deaminase